MRTCEKTYDERMIREAGIQIIEMEFADGSSPPKAAIKQWLQLVKE